MRKYKTPVVLFHPSRVLGKLSQQITPLRFGIVVQPFSCSSCGLVQFFETARTNATPASAGRPFPSPRRETRRA